STCVGPVEADTSRPFLQPKRHQQWGQGGWETTEGPAPRSPFPFFHALPPFMIRRFRVSEQLRMSPPHFLFEGARHGLRVEFAPFRSDHDLEREVRPWIEVNLAAVVENARTVARVAGTRLLPVVKANAYGVGAVAVSRALETVDPWGYGVATVEEGADLRAAGIARPILVFMPARPDLFDAY